MLLNLLRVVTVTLSLGRTLAECQLKGVNIAGFDFGCPSSGICGLSDTTPPLLGPGKWKNPQISKFKYYSDGIGQMAHFSGNHGMNVYRLPVSWQFLVRHKLGGQLDHNAVGLYDDLVQGCLRTGSYCIIDIHNYARWDGKKNIIGQGGPSNAQFSSLWRQLAEKYKNNGHVIFGIMNEPHHLDIDKWAATLQHVVNAIRNAGAKSHMILLPGTDYTNALGFEKESAPALSRVKNPDGSYDNLIFEVHQYFANKPGEKSVFPRCNTDHIDDAFEPLANWLRLHKRKAFVGEAGGSPTEPSCREHVCSFLSYINKHSDVYLGFTGWSAGAFFPNGELAITPKGSAKKGWVDQPLLTDCFAKDFSAGGSYVNKHTQYNQNGKSGHQTPVKSNYKAPAKHVDPHHQPAHKAPAKHVDPHHQPAHKAPAKHVVQHHQAPQKHVDPHHPTKKPAPKKPAPKKPAPKKSPWYRRPHRHNAHRGQKPKPPHH